MSQAQKTVAIIQGRMSSSRLPGKVLKDIAGQPMLAHVVERARRARLLDEVLVATTLDPSDDAIETFCLERAYPVFRGSLHDVLDRFYQAARAHHADVVVRLTADCPVIDPALIDQTIQAFLDKRADFAANRLPPPFHRTFPIGLDTEVVSFAALERAWKEASAPHEREHVMPYFYDVEGRFKIARVEYDQDFGSMRWTVDTPEDLEVLRRIFGRLSNTPNFTWLDVLHLVQREPNLMDLNADVHHKTYFDVDERMKKA